MWPNPYSEAVIIPFVWAPRGGAKRLQNVQTQIKIQVGKSSQRWTSPDENMCLLEIFSKNDVLTLNIEKNIGMSIVFFKKQYT